MRRFILNDAGEPIECCDDFEWHHWMYRAMHEKRLRVGCDVVGFTAVSTVFTGVDVSMGTLVPAAHPPVWEIALFSLKPTRTGEPHVLLNGRPYDLGKALWRQSQWFANKERALAAHLAIVEMESRRAARATLEFRVPDALPEVL